MGSRYYVLEKRVFLACKIPLYNGARHRTIYCDLFAGKGLARTPLCARKIGPRKGPKITVLIVQLQHTILYNIINRHDKAFFAPYDIGQSIITL